MDSGFDDLLAPSRDVMNNPFQDPFSQARSSSPDPWASYGTAVPSFNEEALAFGSTTSPTALTHNAFADVGGFQDHEPEDYTTHDFRRDEPPAQEESEPQEEETLASASPADPLDTAAFNAAEAAAEAEEAAAAAASSGLPTGLVTSPSQSRGFRESISTDVEEPPKPSEPEPSRTPTPPVAAEQTPKPSSPSVAELPGRTAGHVSRGSTASFSSSQIVHKAEPTSVNPLDQHSALNRSIAGLSIGGETLGGWQGASGGWQTQTAYTVPEPSRTQNQTVSDDDDDDDRPIAQTMAARAASAQRATSVRAVLPSPEYVRGPSHCREAHNVCLDPCWCQEGERYPTGLRDHCRRPAKGRRPHPRIHHVHGPYQGTLV